MPPKKTPTPAAVPVPTTYVVKLSPDAVQDLGAISDQNTVRSIIKKAGGLSVEPHKQGKPLKGVLTNYRSVRAAGQRYRIVYQVAAQDGQVVIVVIGIRKDGDKVDAYAVASKRLR
jgi:mRNA interferase RelE/StbE